MVKGLEMFRKAMTHSHRNIEAQIGDTRLVSNQLGYVSYGEHLSNGFKPGKMIEITNIEG